MGGSFCATICSEQVWLLSGCGTTVKGCAGVPEVAAKRVRCNQHQRGYTKGKVRRQRTAGSHQLDFSAHKVEKDKSRKNLACTPKLCTCFPPQKNQTTDQLKRTLPVASPPLTSSLSREGRPDTQRRKRRRWRLNERRHCQT